MALTNGTLWEMRATATTGNVNGSGFNPNNANFLTDFSATSATGNSPVLSSATYNFVAGDVGAWVYVKSGTNWTPGFYEIASVASNQATLKAAIGEALQLNATSNEYAPNTVAGCATTASPTSGTCGVDYSQQDTAVINGITDFGAVGSSTTLSSATAGFTPVMVGNIYHQTTTGTGAFGVTGWYEIVSYTSATAVVLDRTPNSGTASVACTGYVGGAGRMNGLEDAYYEMLPAGSTVFIKSGTYVWAASITISSTNATQQLPIRSIGYTSKRNDTCNDTSRPLMSMGINTPTYGRWNILKNIIYTTTGTNGTSAGNNNTFINCKATNTSNSTGRSGWRPSNSTAGFMFCEGVSQNGIAFSGQAGTNIFGCYFHDSVTGVLQVNSYFNISNSIISSNRTQAIESSGATTVKNIDRCTIYGSQAKIGTGININQLDHPLTYITNCILYGFSTGISVLTAANPLLFGINNCFYNNTTNATNFYLQSDTVTLDPQFTSAVELTGTTATSSASVLTDSGADFSSVQDNVDYLHVISGTGVTTGGYLITSHTTTTLTVNNALGTSSAGDIVYFVPTGKNYGIGTNLKGAGTPVFGTSMGMESTSYSDIGVVQRQETSGGGGSGGSFTFS